MDAQKKTPPASSEQIDQMEQLLCSMEDELQECYCEIGKAILETAETEGKKINSLVDHIIDIRKRLSELYEEEATRHAPDDGKAALDDQQ